MGEQIMADADHQDKGQPHDAQRCNHRAQHGGPNGIASVDDRGIAHIGGS